MSDAPLQVLHADDDESFRLLVERVVRSDDYMASRCLITFVNDGGDAVDYILGNDAYADRRTHPLPDLILLDQRMVRMDGIEALKHIKSDPTGRNIPTFLFSTSHERSLISACYESGASFCIRKPLDFSRLQPTLRLVMTFAREVLELPDDA